MGHLGKSADFSILARLTMLSLSLIAYLPHRSVGIPNVFTLPVRSTDRFLAEAHREMDY